MGREDAIQLLLPYFERSGSRRYFPTKKMTVGMGSGNRLADFFGRCRPQLFHCASDPARGNAARVLLHAFFFACTFRLGPDFLRAEVRRGAPLEAPELTSQPIEEIALVLFFVLLASFRPLSDAWLDQLGVFCELFEVRAAPTCAEVGSRLLPEDSVLSAELSRRLHPEIRYVRRPSVRVGGPGVENGSDAGL